MPATLPLELRLWLSLTTRLPPVYKAQGLANHLARRIWLRSAREPVPVERDGVLVELDPAELTEGLWLFAPQLHDRQELRFLKRALAPGDCFADLGAHVGRYALPLARYLGPRGRVIAVEPDPRSAPKLREAAARNALRVSVFEVLLGAKAGTGTLQLGPASNRGASTAASTGLSRPQLRMVDLLRSTGNPVVHAAKLDLEGAEVEVLEDWLSPLSVQLRPRALVVERHPSWVARGRDPEPVLNKLGYTTRRAGRFNLLAARERR